MMRRIVGVRSLGRAFLWSICLVAMAVGGCKKSYSVAEVEGRLIVGGQPAPKVRIEFVPDVDSGTKGPSSVAETDAQGNFKLSLIEKDLASARAGAVVGHHRVALTDLRMAESSTGRGVPVRFGSEYTLPGSTPLRQEVKEGPQTIEIKVP